MYSSAVSVPHHVVVLLPRGTLEFIARKPNVNILILQDTSTEKTWVFVFVHLLIMSAIALLRIDKNKEQREFRCITSMPEISTPRNWETWMLLLLLEDSILPGKTDCILRQYRSITVFAFSSIAKKKKGTTANIFKFCKQNNVFAFWYPLFGIRPVISKNVIGLSSCASLGNSHDLIA